MMDFIKSTPFNRIFVTTGIFLLSFLIACEKNSTGIDDETPKSADYSAVLSGAINRSYDAQNNSDLVYYARLDTVGAQDRLRLAFVILKQDQEMEERGKLDIMIPISNDGFQLAEGQYRIEAEPISATSLQGNFAFLQSSDEANFESYTFRPSALLVIITAVSGDRITGKFQFSCHQRSGQRSVNNVVEEINLAYDGRMNIQVDFDIEILNTPN